jgi:uncharacterized protein (TIGR00251 family)
MSGTLFQPVARGLKVALRVTPNAARDRIDGVETRPGAGPQLRIRVRAVPDKGKANNAVIALLAETWDLPKSAFSIVAGETARDKTLLIDGAPEQLTALLAPWLEAHR